MYHFVLWCTFRDFAVTLSFFDCYRWFSHILNDTLRSVPSTDYFKQHVFDYVTSPNEWKFIGQRPAIIDFYAKWCGPCKGMAPHLDQIAEEFEGKLDVYKVDVDQEVELTEVFGVRSMPTLLFVPQEGLPQKAVGAMTYGQLKEVIEDILLPKA